MSSERKPKPDPQPTQDQVERFRSLQSQGQKIGIVIHWKINKQFPVFIPANLINKKEGKWNYVNSMRDIGTILAFYEKSLKNRK